MQSIPGFNAGSQYNPLQQFIEQYLAPADTETADIDVTATIVKVTVPGSGTGKVKMPHARDIAGRIITIMENSGGGGGGAIQVVNQAGTDIVGDNIAAADDRVAVYSDGLHLYVIADVTV